MSRFDSAAATLGQPWPARLTDYWEITKPGIAGAVLMTAISGFLLGGGLAQPGGWLLLFHMALGTALTCFGAGSLNMLLEIDADAVMDRTRNRPLPAGRLAPQEAFVFGVLSGSIGVVHLAATCGLAASLFAALSLATYIALYTPMKRYSSFCTVVGAVSGALPPLIGWSAAGRISDPRGWILFSILFLWQFPHLLALAWMYRADYGRAGFRMMPVPDETAVKTTRAALALCLVLLPLSVVPFWADLAGPLYLPGCLAINGFQLYACAKFFRRRSQLSARRFFLSTVLYIPILFSLLVLGR